MVSSQPALGPSPTMPRRRASRLVTPSILAWRRTPPPTRSGLRSGPAPCPARVADRPRAPCRRGRDRERHVGVILAHVLAREPLADGDDPVPHASRLLEGQFSGQPPHLLFEVPDDGEPVLARQAGAGHQLDGVGLEVLLLYLEGVDRLTHGLRRDAALLV